MRGRGWTDQAVAGTVPVDDLGGWLSGRLPDGWFTGDPQVVVDRDEITVIGSLGVPDAADETHRAGAVAGRVSRFREQTRRERMAIADEAEARYGRKVAWGVEVDGEQHLFTTLAVPAMTRLRQPERRVLDTLVEAGVARSRSDALAWCVRLVGRHEKEWIDELREALAAVEKARASGPAG